LISNRATRETKKTTKAAAVHGWPFVTPAARTTTAPIANSVSQKARAVVSARPPSCAPRQASGSG
jgi:hypothetical protein